MANNSSDEFDICNPNQSTKPIIPAELDLKLTSRRHSKSPEAGCSSRKSPDNISSKRTELKNKLSSKLSTKNKTGNKTVLKDKTVIEDEEDDFQFVRKVQKRGDKPSGSRSRRGKKLSSRNEFLLSQAEVSRSDISGQESDCEGDDEDADLLEGSFIDDESTGKMGNTDMHAFYLKSLKNCAGMPKKFKLKAVNINKFLPNNDSECSDYEFDSFCVGDEDVTVLTSDDDLGQDSLLACRNKPKIPGKTKNKKKRRVVVHDSTSSEHESSPNVRKCVKRTSSSSNIPDDQCNDSIIAVKKPKHRLVIISSDEEEEHAFVKPANPESHKTERSVNGKNTKGLLQCVVNQNSSTSNEHKTSSKVKKCDSKLSCHGNVSASDHDDNAIIVLETKHKEVINSHKKDEPINSEFGKRTGGVTAPSNNKKVCSPAKEPAFDSTNTEKFQFSIDFDINDAGFISSVNEKVEDTGSAKFGNNSHTKGVTSACIATTVNNLPSTSSSKNCDFNLTQVPEVCNQITDVSFDIAWDEVFPSALQDPEVSSSILPNESALVSKPTTIDRSDSATIILVDSRELSSGKPVISTLRNKHKVNPIVMPLSSADYIISNRIAVERVLDSEFNSNPMPPKIVEKIKEVIDVYEKAVVVIEKDNRKNVLSFNKNVTKYLQFVVHLNSHPCIKVLFSKSTDHTSELIVSLIQQERRKGFHINVPVDLNAKNRKLFEFYCSFPKVSPVCALNFMYYFPTVESLLKASLEDLKKKGCISSHRAVTIHNYFKSKLTLIS